MLQKSSQVNEDRRNRFRNFMDSYYMMRHAWLLQCENATGMYPAEVEEFKKTNPPVLFHQYLRDSRGMPR